MISNISVCVFTTQQFSPNQVWFFSFSFFITFLQNNKCVCLSALQHGFQQQICRNQINKQHNTESCKDLLMPLKTSMHSAISTHAVDSTVFPCVILRGDNPSQLFIPAGSVWYVTWYTSIHTDRQERAVNSHTLRRKVNTINHWKAVSSQLLCAWIHMYLIYFSKPIEHLRHLSPQI